MKQTRKQKIAQQQKTRDWLAGRKADRAIAPIHEAIEQGDLVVGPAPRLVKPPRNFSPPQYGYPLPSKESSR